MSEIISKNTDLLEMVRDSAKEFSSQYLFPNVIKWDESQFFPVEALKKAGSLGFMGVFIPESYGGSGLGYLEYASIIEEISKIDPSIGLSVAAHNSLCINHIYMFGNEMQKKKWLPQLASAEHIGAWGLTEQGTGSDAKGMEATAKKKEGKWVLNGTKNFITHGKSGDIAVAIFRTGEKGDTHGMTAFVIERGREGFFSGKKENKLGMRASETAEMIFDNCIIPDENRLGEVGEGFTQSMKILDGGRISIAALSLGIAKGAYNIALKYSKERKQFGKPISSFQAISFKLAEMATKIEASSLLIKSAADLKNKNKKVTKIASMAKLYASESCVKIANEAVQILGGYGYVKEFLVEKFYRDAKLCTIGEGTSEIQKIVIAKNILENN